MISAKVFPEEVRKWGPAIIVFLLGVAGYTYKMSTNESRVIYSLSDPFYERREDTFDKLEPMASFVTFYGNEWHPKSATALEAFKAQQSGPHLTPRDMLKSIDHRQLQDQQAEIERLQMKVSSYFFDDKSFAEWVRAISTFDDNLVRIMSGVEQQIKNVDSTDAKELSGRLEEVSSQFSDESRNFEYIEELTARCMNRLEKYKSRAEHYMDRYQAITNSASICYWTFLIITLLINTVTFDVIVSYVSLRSGSAASGDPPKNIAT